MAYPYYYPSYYYVPQHHVTYLTSSFPEHHGPLHDTRHKIGQSLHELWRDSWPQPKADVRETLHKFYIDIEAPGIGSDKEVQLRWTNSRTLFAEFELKERPLPEEEEALLAQQKATEEAAATDKQDPSHAPADHVEKDPKHHVAHSLVKERQLGRVKRAFYFYVDVDREQMSAHLRHGILEITIAKKDDEHRQGDPEVKVVSNSGLTPPPKEE